MAHANKTKPVRAETALRVLFLDIETSPNMAYIWGQYEQDAVGDLIQERQIICFAWNWLGEKEIHALALPMFPGYRKNRANNRELIKRLHAIVSEADIVVGHNLAAFDDRMANTDFIVNGLPPPPPHRIIDTLKVARQRFRFNSNRLDALGQRLGVGRKVQHRGFSMWLGCLSGDRRSWAEMVKYNMGDIVLLKRIYEKMRPWMTNHPNLTAPLGIDACPACKSKRLNRSGWLYTKTGRVQRFACRDCGRWSSGKFSKDRWRFT